MEGAFRRGKTRFKSFATLTNLLILVIFSWPHPLAEETKKQMVAMARLSHWEISRMLSPSVVSSFRLGEFVTSLTEWTEGTVDSALKSSKRSALIKRVVKSHPHSNGISRDARISRLWAACLRLLAKAPLTPSDTKSRLHFQIGSIQTCPLTRTSSICVLSPRMEKICTRKSPMGF